MKKRILSILLIMSVMASIFALSAATTDAAVKPPTPSVTVVNGGSAQGLFVKWNSVGAYTSYQVAYRPAGNYGCGKGYTYRATANTNILLTGLKSGTCYQVQVRAYRNGVYGNYSNTKSMTFVEYLNDISYGDYEGIGRFFVDSDYYDEFEISDDLCDYFDFAGFGAHMAEEKGGQFVSGGFVFYVGEDGVDSFMDKLEDESESMTLGGM